MTGEATASAPDDQPVEPEVGSQAAAGSADPAVGLAAEAPVVPDGSSNDVSVEDLLDSLEEVTRERDEYLEQLQRLQAEFDNFRKRTMAATDERVAAGLGRLADALLPVLDACDAAVQAGEESVGAVGKQLLDVLGKEGLSRIDTVGQPFDPEVHEAVLHEAGDTAAPVVVDELRGGYVWGARVLRAAMVKVSG